MDTIKKILSITWHLLRATFSGAWAESNAGFDNLDNNSLTVREFVRNAWYAYLAPLRGGIKGFRSGFRVLFKANPK